MQPQDRNKLQDLLTQGARFYDSQQYDKAIEYYTRVIELAPSFATGYKLRIDAYEKTNRRRDVINDYKKLAFLYPQSSETYYNWGVQCLMVEDFPTAVTAFSCALAMKPNFGFAFSNRGLALARIGSVEWALEDLDTAIKLMPDDAISYNIRGRLLIALGDTQSARLDLEKAAHLGQPDAIQALKQLK
jgi:tetratricopeptide (TPR) repeat protein